MENKKNEMQQGIEQENETEKCCCRTKHREDKEYRDLMNRLKRIEGQVRGIQGMVEEERYCVEILTQVMAIQSALNSFNKVLLSNHIKTCVVRDIKNGDADAVDELCSTIQKLMK
ncbi:MAG: metal-sensing transcriptional repressor [bacterium]|nr:metal-sensing transcriptional repressor [bacterium]